MDWMTKDSGFYFQQGQEVISSPKLSNGLTCPSNLLSIEYQGMN
jgi:hypothetical protein